MIKFICTLITILLIFLAAGLNAFAQEKSDLCIELDNTVDSMVGHGKAKGAVLSVVKDGQIRLCKGYGFADEFFDIPADGEKTAFRIGSVSKTFVAVAAQILNQEGKLDMNRDISFYLEPDFPALAYPVTMHHLLTHTAGFEDIVTGMAVPDVSDTEPLAVSVHKYLPAQIFKSGETVSYSNYGIALAAYVVECIAEQDFSRYCREQVFLPLDMSRTTFEHMHDIAYVSKPYLPDGTETLEPNMNLYPEGSAVSTAEDMAKYMLWLLDEKDNRVLSTESKEDIFRNHFSMSEELEGVGYTWNRKARNNMVYYDKKGETLNFYTRIILYPQQGTGIFLSFNTYLPEHEINSVQAKATNILYGEAELSGFNSGKSNFDISGLYANNWSSYKTPEKILRYLVPGKILHITRSDDGFSLNGEQMSLIGEDTYSSSIGILKFVQKDGEIIIATESAITYSKIPLWQHGIIQILIPAAFLALAFICLLRELILRITGKRSEHKVIFLICSLIQVISFCALFLLMYYGIISFTLLEFSIQMKTCGWLILAACAAVMAYSIYLNIKHEIKKMIPALWNFAGILFCVWMSWFNII